MPLAAAMTPAGFVKLARLDRSRTVAVIVDGPTTYWGTRALNYDLDYRLIHDLIADNSIMHRAVYVTAFNDELDHDPVRPLYDWLTFNGWQGVSKLMDIDTNRSGVQTYSCDLHSEITVELMRASTVVDHIFLFSNDQDLVAGVLAAQSNGARVTVVGHKIEHDLRRAADQEIELEVVRDFAQRDFIARENRRSAPPRSRPGQFDDQPDDLREAVILSPDD